MGNQRLGMINRSSTGQLFDDGCGNYDRLCSLRSSFHGHVRVGYSIANVLKNGVEVKLQRNALSILEPPTGHEEDDEYEFDISSSGSDDNEFSTPNEFSKLNKPKVRYVRPWGLSPSMMKSGSRNACRETQSNIHMCYPNISLRHSPLPLASSLSDALLNLQPHQVRVDFLSSDGNVLASTRQPCMLRFKSQPIRLVSAFLKLASLLTGYSSETQTLDMKFRGYIEKDVHTSCSRVVIEQRAEFARRGGVPEVYSASLKIESRLPFVKRMLWYSKWLIYMWISVTMYIMELLFTLLCCRSIIFPWELSLGRDLGSSNDSLPHNKPNASS